MFFKKDDNDVVDVAVEEVELFNRNKPSVRRAAIDVVEDLTGMTLNHIEAGDVASAMEGKKKKPARIAYERKGRKAAWKRREMRVARKARLDSDEVRLSKLKVKLMAGDPSHPLYEKRLAAAKKTVRLATSLPVIARQKWSSPSFQKEMEEKGHRYNPAQYRGWLPYETAKRVQREVVGARSRGEYEFFVKLYELKFLPARPDRVYEEEWEGWGEFLGLLNMFRGMKVEKRSGAYRPFIEAVTFVRQLKLKSAKQWRQACADNLVPLDIPVDPHRVYPEFVNLEHWLGMDTAYEKITGKVDVAVNDVWVLYTDGREGVFWWAKMSEEKFGAFSELEGVQVERVYKFEGELSEEVWKILDQCSEQYEMDKRERMAVGGNGVMGVRNQLDAILSWRNV